MSNCISFHSQLASIMEVLSKAAVAEITKLVDDGSAVLRLEVCRSQKENAALKRKLQLMEKELRAARGCGDRAQEGSVNISLEVQVCDESGGAEELPEKGNRPAVEAVCDGPLSSGLTCDGETAPGNKEETPSQIVAIKYESTDVDQDWPESHMLSEERRQSALERSRSQAKHRIGGELQWGVSQPSAAHVVEEAASEPWHSEEELDTKPTPAEDPGQLGAAYRPEEFRGLEATLKQQPDLCTQSLHQAGAATGLRLQSVWSKHAQRTQQDISTEHGLAVCSPGESEEGAPFDEGFATSVKISSLQGIDEEKKFISTTCEKVFTDALKHEMHQQYHSTGRPVTCAEHGKSFTYSSSLKIHRRIHTGEQPFACSECDKTFSQWHVLKTHESIHTRARPYACTQCGKRFRYKGYLKIHQRVHTREKPFTCMQCGKCFSQISNLKTHQITHTGEKSYSCTQCDKTFSYLHVLKHHQNMHIGGKSFSCKLCGKILSSENSLKQHQIAHRGTKRFNCTLCGKGFTAKSSLKAHQSVHTGEKPFSCTDCGKSFAHLCNLKTHQRVHTGEKPFTCTQCGKSFSQNHVLQKHVLTHCGD